MSLSTILVVLLTMMRLILLMGVAVRSCYLQIFPGPLRCRASPQSKGVDLQRSLLAGVGEASRWQICLMRIGGHIWRRMGSTLMISC